MNPLRSVGARLALALAVVVAGALALVYAIVVPSLQHRLIDSKLNQLRSVLPEIERDDRGFIKTGDDVAEAPAWRANKRRPGPLETSLPGIFAAGDVRSGSVKRCAAAVGEGGMAVAGIHLSLASRRNA